MINRDELIAEQLLRENIRRAIRIVQEKRNKEEQMVRSIVRSLLSEGTTIKYEYTSLNQLAHFIKEAVGDPAKPDANPAFKDAYTDLTSSHEDREVFVEYVLDFADENSYAYLDPPYYPISSTSNFTSYTKEKFGIKEQENLKEVFLKLDEIGSKVMLSNSYCDFILDLYKEYKIQLIEAKRFINSDATKRGKIKEVLIMNY